MKSRGTVLARALALSLAYFAGAELGQALTFGSPGFSTFWPCGGLFLGTLLLSKRRHWPLLVLATLPANLTSDVLVHGKSVPVGLAFWFANATEAILSATLFQRWIAPQPSFARLRDALGLVAVPTIGAALAATMGTLTVHWAFGASSLLPVWLAWWTADMLGILVVVPVLVAFAKTEDDEPLRLTEPAKLAEAALLLVAFLILGHTIFHHASGLSWPAPSFGVPFLLWATLRFGRRGLSLMMAGGTVLALDYLLRGKGAPVLASIHPLERALSMEFFLATLAGSFLILGAILAERDRAQRVLNSQATELRRFAQAVESATDGIIIAGPTGIPIYHNWAAISQLGYTAKELAELGGPKHLVSDPAIAQSVADAIRVNRPWVGEMDMTSKDGRTVPVHVSASPFKSSDGKADGRIAILTFIEERRRREQRRAIEYEITRILAGSSSLEGTVPELLRCSCELLGWDNVTLWLLDEQTGEMFSFDTYSRDKRLAEYTESSKRFRFRAGVGPGRVLSINGPVWIEDLHFDPPGPQVDYMLRNHVQAALAIPVRAAGRITGAFGFLSTLPKPKDPAMLQVLEAVGLQMGLFLQRARAMEALKLTTELAQAASRAKSDFLANVSHEIRTPVNAVLGMLELLSGTKVDAAQRRYIEVASSSGRALTNLIEDVLDFSRIEAGKLELHPAPLHIHRLVTDVVDAFSTTAKSRNLSLTLHVSSDVPEVLAGDSVRLRQVLANLIGNGLKFTHEGGVSVRASVASSEQERVLLRFEVADTGIGIPRERHESIFDTFEQGDPTITRRYGGTGLGLAISRRLVSLMGGHLTVESVPGSGSVFRFTVRLGRAENAPLSEPAPPPSIGPSAMGRLKILVFEDSEVNREVARGILERDGHVVTLCADATNAVEAALSEAYDLILMDLQMPGVSGFEATASIREAEQLLKRPKTPIIAFTARALAEDRERCLAAGMDGYVVKPFRLAELRREMACALGSLPNRPKTEEPAPTPEEQMVILDAEELLRLSGSDPAFLEKITSMFARESEAGLGRLKAAIATGDLETAANVAHKLKSAIGSIGGRRAYSVAKRVEGLAREGTSKDLGETVHTLEVELAELRAAAHALSSRHAA